MEIPKLSIVRRSLFLTVVFFLLAQVICLKISDITLEGSKTVVKYKREWARKKNRVKHVDGKDIVFFMGNSKIAAGIIPRVFDKENMNTTHAYNLALPALPLAPHYFMLKDYLRKNEAPQYIVMQLSIGGYQNKFFPIYAIQGAGLFEVLCYYSFRRDFSMVLNYLIPSRSYWPEVKRYCIGEILSVMPEEMRKMHRNRYYRRFRNKETYHHNWKYFYEAQYVSAKKYMEERKEYLKINRGYYYIIEQAAIGGKLPDDFTPKRNEKKRPKMTDYDPFAERFFKLAEEHNIKIMLIESYQLSYKGRKIDSENHKIPQSWISLKKRYENIGFSKNGFRPKLYPAHFFSDPTHLNPEGAERYTMEIAQEFREVISTLDK
jgi:hypothetical protein